jgi:predicted transcriptional regulator
MIRAIISLDPEEKRWLQRMARKQDISMTAIIRNIIKEYRVQNKELALTKIDALLAQTKGIWKDSDGSTYQHNIRKEWDE